MSFKERLAKLIDVKTVVTFTVIGVFSYLAVIGKIEPKDFMGVVLMIVTFFFAKKSEDK
jgi:hypothetical protein